MTGKNEITAFLKLNGKGFQRGLARARRDLKKFRQGVNSELKKVAVGLAAVTVAAGVIGVSFEKEMKNVQSVSGATAVELQQLTDSARQMGSETAFSAKQAAEAQYALASAGLNTKQIIETLPAVMNYAGATQSELAASAEAVTGAMNAFGIAAEDSNRVVNVFAAGIANSPLSMERLSEAFSQSSSTAAAFGLSLEESVAGLGLLHAANIKGGKAGTAFQSSLLAMSKAMVDQKGAVGHALQGWDSATEGLTGAIVRLERAGVSGQRVLQELGAKGGPALAAMLAQGSVRLRELQRNVTGTNQAFDAYKTQMDSTGGLLDTLMSAVEEAGLRVFAVIKGPLDEAIAGLTATVQANYGRITQVFSALLAGVLQFAEVAGAIFGFVADHSAVFQTFGTIILAAAGALYVVSTATAAWNAVLALNPITLIVAGIAAAIAAIIVLVEKFVGWKVVWAGLVGAVKVGVAAVKGDLKQFWAEVKFGFTVFQALNETVGIVFDAIWGVMKKAGELISEAFSSIWTAIKDPRKAKEAFDQLKETLSQGLGPVIDEAREQLEGTWTGLADSYHEESAEIARQTAADINAAVEETKAKIAELKRERASVAEGPAPANVPSAPPGEQWGVGVYGLAGVDMTKIPMPNLVDPMRKQAEDIYSVHDEISKSTADLYRSTWDSMLDSGMTGAERNRRIFAEMRSHIWGIVGDITKRWLWGEAVQAGATVAKEEVQTGATTKGAAVRIATKLKEMAIDLKTGVVNAWNATTGFFKAHSSIPFVGAAMAAAAVALMFKLMGAAKKALFYDGGLVTGPYGRDVINAGLTRGEFVMPVGPTQQWLPLLESMRAGSFAGAPAMVGAVPVASGGGGVTVNATVQVDSGSLILADNDLSVRRLAEKIAWTIEEKVNKTFRSNR